MSKHKDVEPGEVCQFLDRQNFDFKVLGAEVVVKECPFCHDTGGKPDNLWKLYIGLEKGSVLSPDGLGIMFRELRKIPPLVRIFENFDRKF